MKIISNLLALIALTIYQSSVFALQFSLEAITSKAAFDEIPIAITPIPKQSPQYFVVNQTGTIIVKDFADANAEPKTIFDATKVFPSFIELSAFTLHPNFSMRDQQGHFTFYTAHSENLSSERKKSAVVDKSLRQDQIVAESVITEWQLDENLNVDLSSKREVIRFKAPTTIPLINQLSFNPNLKVWHEQFGDLYFSLNKVDGFESNPLHSGAVLRINPQRFGLKNYTIPVNNPYKEDNTIADEIVLYNLNELGSFHWSKQGDNQLLLDHKIDGSRQLSHVLVDGKSNTVNKLVALSQQEVGQHQAIYYFGKQFSYLFGSVMLTNFIDGHWQVQSIEPSSALELTTLWPIDTIKKSLIFTGHNGEPLLFNGETMQLSQLVKISIPGQEESQDFQEPTTSDSGKVFLLLILAGGILWLFISIVQRTYKGKNSSTNFYHQQFTHFECSSDKQVLHIFRHHQKAPEQSLHIHHIKQICILINEHEILTLDSANGMTNDLEQVIREAFNIEKREKMVPNKTRAVHIDFTDSSGTVFPVYLYLRKGDSRISKMKYDEVCNHIIDWCWQLAEQICSNQTETRKLVEQKPVAKKPKIKPNQVNVNPAPSRTEAQTTIDNQPAQISRLTEDETKPSIEQAHLDTEIVTALEKLAKLKAEGFLSEEEFEQAKAKLLKGLI